MDASNKESVVEPIEPIFTTPRRGPYAAGNCIGWLSDDRILVDWGDNTLRIWNLTNNTQEGMSMAHQGYLCRAITTKDGRIISHSSADRCLMVWNADTHELMDGLQSTEEYGLPLCMALSRNEDLLASCHEKGIVIWDMVGAMRIRNCIDCESIEGYDYIKSACFSPDGKEIAALFGYRTVVVLDAASGEVKRCVKEAVYTIYSIVWSSEGILCGCLDARIRCLDSSTGKIVGDPWTGHNGHVTCLSLSADGNFLASGSQFEQVVRLWDAKDGKALGPPLEHSSFVSAVAFSPSEEFVACTGRWGHISVWRVPWWDSLQQKAVLDLSAVPSEGPSNIPREADLDFLDTPAQRPHPPLQQHSRVNPSSDPSHVQRSVLSWRWWKTIPRFRVVHSRPNPIYMAEAPPRTAVASRETVHSGGSPVTQRMPRYTVVVEGPPGSAESSDESSSNATPASEPEVSQVGCCGLWSRGQPGAAAAGERRNVPAARPSSSTRPPDSVNVTHPGTQDILELSAVVRSPHAP